MTVYVWTPDGTYVGQIAHDPDRGMIVVRADDPAHKAKIEEALLATQGSNRPNIDIRYAAARRLVEFLTEEWITLASLLFLPPAGYRVHIIREAATL